MKSSILKEVKDGFFGIFFPQQCRTCLRYMKDFKYEYVCRNCFESMRKLEAPMCTVCGKPLSSEAGECRECRERKNYFEYCRPAGVYEGALKDIIYALKFDYRERAAKVLAEYICEKTALNHLPNDYVIVPVPANRSAVKKRGFCHIKAAAKHISARTGHRTMDIITKVKETEAQNKLERKKRLTNLKGAFKADERAAGIKAAVLDDVFTTGSTINEAAKALKKAGAVSVIGVVAARSI